jgi:GNAT superfamily N-acetyltransferase
MPENLFGTAQSSFRTKDRNPFETFNSRRPQEILCVKTHYTRAMRTRLATHADLEPAALILRNAALRLEAAGEALWNPASFTAATLEPIFEASELCVVVIEENVVGVMYLQERDVTFWPDEPVDNSLFIHKLAVDNEFRGRGVSTALLEFARGEAISRGKRWVRLDCANRPKLRAIYERFGFQLRDSRVVYNFQVCRLELPLEI